jgi:DNA-binding transcriptional LysR family regulator
MTLQQLRYALAAADHGSFSAAASRLRLAQPSLSEQIRTLEAELGVRLFTRTARGLVPTAALEALRPHAERVLSEIEALRDSVAEVRELRGGTVSFGTFGFAGDYLLTDLVAEMRGRHPSVRVRVVGRNSADVADGVRAGTLEAGLVVLPIEDAGLDVRPVFREPVLYASAEPARTAVAVTIEALADAPLILCDSGYANRDPLRRQVAARAQEAGVRLEPVIEVEELWTALDMAARGLGDTIVGAAVTLREGFPRGLRTAPFADPLEDVLAVVSRRGAPLSPAVRELVRLAERLLDDLARRLAGERADGGGGAALSR